MCGDVVDVFNCVGNKTNHTPKIFLHLWSSIFKIATWQLGKNPCTYEEKRVVWPLCFYRQLFNLLVLLKDDYVKYYNQSHLNSIIIAWPGARGPGWPRGNMSQEDVCMAGMAHVSTFIQKAIWSTFNRDMKSKRHDTNEEEEQRWWPPDRFVKRKDIPLRVPYVALHVYRT